MDVGATLVADDKTAVTLQPREGALDDPAASAQSRFLFPSFSNGIAQTVQSAIQMIAVAVVCLVGESGPLGLRLADDGFGSLQHRRQSGPLMHIGGAERCGQRYSLSVRGQMYLGAWFSPITRVGSGICAPFFAGTSEESTMSLSSARVPCCLSS